MLTIRNLIIAILLPLALALFVYAGDIDQSVAPGAGGRMYTLEQIYAKTHNGTNATKHPDGSFTEPSSGPASTMYTLDQVYGDFNTDATACTATASDVLSTKTFFATTGSARGTTWGPVTGTANTPPGSGSAAGASNILTGYYAFNASGEAINGSASSSSYGIPKTQQNTYVDYDDGYYHKGTPASGNHYTDNGDGTITDNATGLMWVKSGYADADTNPATGYTADGSWRKYTWANAILYCYRLNDTTQFPPSGYLGHNDWRLPNVKELQSIINYGNWSPAIGESTVGGSGTGAPFTNTKSNYYWSSTTSADGTAGAWYVSFGYGVVNVNGKTLAYYVRPVRGG